MTRDDAAVAPAPAPAPAALPRTNLHLKYFFGFALWSAVGLAGAMLLGVVPLTRELIGGAVIGLVLVSMAAAWLLELMDRRLAAISAAADQLAAGMRQVRLAAPRHDELSALTDAFNHLAANTDARVGELQSRVQQQRSIAEHGPDAMWVFHVEGFKLIDVNENFAALSGYARGELIGKTPMDVSPPMQIDGRSTEEHARWIIEGALRGAKIVTRWTLRNRSGEDVPCELRAVHLPSPGRTLICGSLMDIRDRLRTESELAERMRLEGLITRLSSVMSGLTPERSDEDVQGALADLGQFAGVDRSYIFLFDESQSTVSCTHEWCAPGIVPQVGRLKDLRVADYPWVEAQLLRGEVVHVPRVDGVPAEAAAERAEWQAEAIRSLLLVPLRTAGRTRGYVGFDAVRAEKSWSQDSIDLLRIFGEILLNAITRVQAEGALRQRNEELRRTVEELERSNEELQQFAYIASHDLQEPLRSIGSFSELLRRRYSAQLDGRGLNYLEFVTDAAKRMHALINALLDYSRIEARSRPFEPCSLETVLELALANLDASIRDTGATITHDPLPQVHGDPSQLTQLLQNLLGNAVKFHGREPPRVHVGAVRLENGAWELSVADNGIGIDATDARRLFQLFRRIHGPDRYPGTGIGLATCKRIVERHHGRIWVSSTPGCGATFRFTLPQVLDPGAGSGARLAA